MSTKVRSKEEDFLRAAWDNLADVCDEHRVQVMFRLLPIEELPGRFRIRLVSKPDNTNDWLSGLVVYEIEYPNGAQTTLAAALFNAVVKMDAMLTEQSARTQAALARG